MRRDKVGFETPDDEWFRSKVFKEVILDLLHSRKFRERGYLKMKNAIKSYTDHLNRRRNISNEIWKWLNLELWFERFIEDKECTDRASKN